MARRYTHEEFINIVKKFKRGKLLCDKTKYINTRTPIIIHCPKHGYLYNSPKSLISPHHINGCRLCGKEAADNSHRMAQEEFIKLAKAKYGDKYDYSVTSYIANDKPIDIICPKHGKFTIKCAGQHLRGDRCRSCTYEDRSYSQDVFLEKAYLRHGNRYSYNNVVFKNATKDKISITCPIHGDFLQIPEIHLRGSGCPKCMRSTGETEIARILDKYGINYQEQYRLPENLKMRYDFYIPDINLLIEYNGIQHYKQIQHFGGKEKFIQQQRNDIFKKDLALKNNKDLFIIPYTYNKRLEQILLNKFIINYCLYRNADKNINHYLHNYINGANMSGILRSQDWSLYPQAIVHVTTKNKSFLRVAQIYKSMGIKNHAFLLALHNPDLADVDPFSDDLTEDQINAIGQEIAENPWYFFREIIRIPASGTVNGVSFIANRANIAYLWCCFNHLTTMIIMPRQTGKSVVADSCNVYILIAGGNNIKMVLFTKDNGLRVSNIERLKAIFDLLPWYINPRDKSDSNNTENITINALQNRLDTVVGQTTLAGAMKVGRGLTVAILQVDELAFIPHIKESLETALAATGAARENAKASGSHYYNTYTTTPGYVNTEEGAYAKSIYDSCCRWTEKFLDLPTHEELESTVRKNTRRGNFSILIEFNHRQLGKTDQWLKERILEANATGDRAEADFLNKWSQGTAASPISKENLIKLRESIVSKSYIEISTEGYVMNWYIPEEDVMNGLNGRQIVLGMDSSEMIGNDNTTFCGRDVVTGEVICTALINETNVLTLSNFVANFLIKYPNITFVPEAKSTGVAIIDTVAQIFISKGINPFTRIFNYVVDEKDIRQDYEAAWGNINKSWNLNEWYNKYRREFGYRTSGIGKNSRDNLYGTVFNFMIKYTSHLTRDEDLVTELESLIIKNGRIDHPTNGHDDMCICGMLPIFFLTQAKNHELYGIDKEKILAGVRLSMTEENGGPIEEYRKAKQKQIKDTIDVYLDRIKRCEDPYITQQLIAKTKALYNTLDNDFIVSFNLQDMLDKISSENRLKRIDIGGSKKYAF